MGIAVIILITFLGIGFGVSGSASYTDTSDVDKAQQYFNQTTTNTPTKHSALGNYSHAAVAADGGAICAQIGRY